MQLEQELEIAQRITEQFHPEEEIPLKDTEKVSELVDSVRSEIARLTTDQAFSEIFGMAALHSNAHVRYYMLGVAKENVGNVFAQEFIQDMTHDDEDYVAFRALRLIRDLRLQRVLDDLMSFIGPPSERIRQPEGKVGVGGSTVLHAHISLFRTKDVEKLEELEQHLKKYGHLPPDRLEKPHPFITINPSGPNTGEYCTQDRDPPDGMVKIPGGRYQIGIEETELPTHRFDVSDITQPYTVEIEPFYIDKYPVTNAKYDEFVEATRESGGKYGHPGEPESKDRRRNTLHDDRVEPDHPVTGIDWYDAYAYAKWANKDLPIEEEWEIAARGKSGNIFPWGNTFDPDRLNWAGRAFDTEIDDWWDWQETIVEADRMKEIPPSITTSVDAFPSGQSEFGVVDMVGNLWEYTKTNYYTRQEMFPVFGHSKRKAHKNLIEGPQAFPTTKGGTWSSIPEMVTGVYRSSDLMTDRHNEIGFRCVRRPQR